MIRNPFSLDIMEYKAKQGMVVYRSKHHATLKRNYQIQYFDYLREKVLLCHR